MTPGIRYQIGQVLTGIEIAEIHDAKNLQSVKYGGVCQICGNEVEYFHFTLRIRNRKGITHCPHCRQLKKQEDDFEDEQSSPPNQPTVGQLHIKPPVSSILVHSSRFRR